MTDIGKSIVAVFGYYYGGDKAPLLDKSFACGVRAVIADFYLVRLLWFLLTIYGCSLSKPSFYYEFYILVVYGPCIWA